MTGTIICIVLMMIFAFFAFYSMIGYPILLLLINKIKKPRQIEKDYTFEPNVSYLIVAHNEEKCIKQKLENVLSFDYPLNKIQLLVASDFCSDHTDEIVSSFIKEHPDLNILLNKSKEHKGKTNAQNETQKLATGEILVLTDANSIFEKNAIRELVSSFAHEDIFYVCGQLKYVNDDNLTASSESIYWKLELKQRQVESNIQTITAGNGSIYAVRNDKYIDISPVHCHDSEFPRLFSLDKKRALYNPMAIAYEKAGETGGDEFKRKVRMNRAILNIFCWMWKPLNLFRYRWFSFFYFGHRTCRYLLWLDHLAFFISTIVFTFVASYIVGGILIGAQVVFTLLGVVSIKHHIKNKIIRLIGYYSMTVLAQFVGAAKQLLGKSKPVWEKAESTR